MKKEQEERKSTSEVHVEERRLKSVYDEWFTLNYFYLNNKKK